MALKGVFWDIDGWLCAYPFMEGSVDVEDGIAKSGDTYVHKKLWTEVRPKGCRRTYNYYPRGRVEVTARGKGIIYMNPYVDEKLLPEIREIFELGDDYKIVYDNSAHYKCHMEDQWKPDDSK